ncbi:MAG: GDP-mannose 4,6-dehydratase, partial [Gammaproteobacteria bacterium]|nr:GDP-mannose 4,6-dehydratase [Gammaproteobacteria bacterium]
MGKSAILVVGGAGYIGSHMVLDLLRAGYPVVTLDDLSRGHRELVPGGDFIEGDMGDAALLAQIFNQHPIRAVMHFAAHSQVGESVQQPLEYYRNNVANTITLLQSMQQAGIAHFIFSSTAAVYGEPERTPITEQHPCAPTNPYGNTKLTVERLLSDVSYASDLSYSVLRYFNA